MAEVGEGKSFCRTMVILKFLKKDLNHESKQWLLKKLTVEQDWTVKLKCDVVEGTDETVYNIWADQTKLLKAANSMGIKKDRRALGPSGLESLSTTEKQLITLNEINSIRFLWNDDQPKDLPHFHQDQVIFSKCKKEKILTYFPVHNPDTLKAFETTWIKEASNVQPIGEIQEYFGDNVAMYFAFLSFYTNWLIVPAIVGLFFHVMSFFYTFNITCYFSVFNVIWCSVFFVLWKRRETSLAYEWGSLDYKRFDRPRPEFRGAAIEADPVTNRMEPVCNYKSKYYKFFFVSLPIVVLFLAISVSLGFAYFKVEDYVHRLNAPGQPLTWFFWLAAHFVTSVYGILIYVLDIVFRKVAYKLNNWENHRLQYSYDNFLIAKLVVFNFVNYFHSLFYMAFYMQNFELLSKNLAMLLITWQVIQQIQETLLPYLVYKKKKRDLLSDSDGQKDLDYQIRKDLVKEEYVSTFDDFLELFFQFGYVFLFSSVYPMAAFWALLSNLVELRMDAFKLCFILRKPVPKQCDGIGTWLVAFELLGILAVITNCALVAMDYEVIGYFRSTIGFSDYAILLTFVIVEHSLLFVKAIILYLVPSTPHWVKIKMAQKDYNAYQALLEEAESNTLQKGQSSIKTIE